MAEIHEHYLKQKKDQRQNPRVIEQEFLQVGHEHADGAPSRCSHEDITQN